MSTLHPIAEALARAEKNFTRRRAALVALKTHRDKLRQDLSEAIVSAITSEPTATNVELAARFGLRSETSIRRIRHAMENARNTEN